MNTRHRSDRVVFTVQSQGVLGLRSNIPNLSWSFGQQVPPVTADEYTACKLRLGLFVQPDEVFRDLGRSYCTPDRGKYHFLYGRPGGNSVLYRRPFLFGAELFLEASDLLGPEPKIRVNSNYARFVHYRFMNLHSVNFLLTDITTLLLLKRRLAPIHCSAFRKDGRTVVVFAPSNTGKTLTTMMACMEHNADFISEDLAITDGSTIFALPWTSTFRYYGDVDTRFSARLKKRAMDALPFLDLFRLFKDESITNFLSPERICHSSEADVLVILERGSPHIRNENRDTAFQKILNLNRSEFNYQRSLISNAYEFFNPDLDIAGAYQSELEILGGLVDNVQECVSVCSDDPTRYADLLLSTLGS